MLVSVVFTAIPCCPFSLVSFTRYQLYFSQTLLLNFLYILYILYILCIVCKIYIFYIYNITFSTTSGVSINYVCFTIKYFYAVIRKFMTSI